jgi:hypothetical protein
VSQNLHLLCDGVRRTLSPVQSVQPMEYAHMSNINFITRIGQGLLAVAATGVSVLALQIAMLA